MSKPTDVKWLRPEEIKAYEACLQYERNYNSTYHRSLNLKIRKRNAEKNRRIKEALESLSERAEILSRAKKTIPSCFEGLHKEIAAELAGLPRGD